MTVSYLALDNEDDQIYFFVKLSFLVHLSKGLNITWLIRMNFSSPDSILSNALLSRQDGLTMYSKCCLKHGSHEL